eukprot:g38571.t1
MAKEIIEAFVVICQESLESGKVPEDWKMANVAHLFKRGGRQKIGNYSPVSLTCAVGKILETIIKDEIGSACWNCFIDKMYFELNQFYCHMYSYEYNEKFTSHYCAVL